MTDREAFMSRIIDSPDDDAPRLVFADWLDEHGEPERAEFIRVQIRLANLKPTYQVVAYGYNPDDRRVFRDESIEGVLTQVQQYRRQHPGNSSQTGVECIPHGSEFLLRKRERELLKAGHAAWMPVVTGFSFIPRASNEPLQENHVLYRRGFPAYVKLSWKKWLGCADFLLSEVPVTDVELTTRPEFGTGMLPIGFSKPQFVIAEKTIDVQWNLFDEASNNADFDWCAAVLPIRWPSIKKFMLPPQPQFG